MSAAIVRLSGRALRWSVGLVACLVWAFAQAQLANTAETRIVAIGAYTEFGGGDVRAVAETPLAGCEGGFWLSKSDPGFQATLSVLVAAKQSRSPVMIWAATDRIWSGSGAPHCKLYLVELR